MLQTDIYSEISLGQHDGQLGVQAAELIHVEQEVFGIRLALLFLGYITNI